jgi:hypothetical protein
MLQHPLLEFLKITRLLYVHFKSCKRLRLSFNFLLNCSLERGAAHEPTFYDCCKKVRHDKVDKKLFWTLTLRPNSEAALDEKYAEGILCRNAYI